MKSEAPSTDRESIEVPQELFRRIYNTLAWYANKCSYEPPRIGGVLKGCPRGPAPTPSKLAFSARLMMRTIDVDLLKRDGASWPMDDVESPSGASVEPWLILRRGYYYRPERAGYTASVDEAGRYTEAEAKKEAAVDPSIMLAIPLSQATAHRRSSGEPSVKPDGWLLIDEHGRDLFHSESVAKRFPGQVFPLYRHPPSHEPASEFVQIGQLIQLDDGLGTVFADWNEERFKLPPGTKLYARSTPTKDG